MAGKNFLSPYARVFISLAMILVIGYYFVDDSHKGEFGSSLTWLRGAVLAAFIYFFVGAVTEVWSNRKR